MFDHEDENFNRTATNLEYGVEIVEKFVFFPTSQNYLGQGAYGNVYKGFNVDRPCEQVAIKSVASERFKREELQLLLDVKSEYLVKLLLISTRQETTYLVMELCDGDLAGHLVQWTKLDSFQVTLLADNLARGYKVLQSNKIVHRDIKPQNILIKYRKEISSSSKIDQSLVTPAIKMAKLSDFGTSHLLKCDDELHNVAGTLLYMAPEVGANLVSTKAYDHSADMWSIGCVLYECITGCMPFDESRLCKLFLHAACQNYEQQNSGSLADGLPVPFSQRFDYVTEALLCLDPKARMTTQQFYDRAIDEMSKMSAKANVRQRFKAAGKPKWSTTSDFYSKSLTLHLDHPTYTCLSPANLVEKCGVMGQTKAVVGDLNRGQFRTLSDNVLCCQK